MPPNETLRPGAERKAALHTLLKGRQAIANQMESDMAAARIGRILSGGFHGKPRDVHLAGLRVPRRLLDGAAAQIACNEIGARINSSRIAAQDFVNPRDGLEYFGKVGL